MMSYEYIKLIYFSTINCVQILFTDTHTLESLLVELKKVMPAAQFEYDELPSGEVYQCRLRKLQNEAFSVYWWLVKQLCRQGWEPFVATKTDNDEEIHFRLKVD